MALTTTSPSRPAATPVRPRILPCLPVLWRSQDQAQIGLDPRHAVVLDGLDGGLGRALRAMDGGHTVAELSALAAPRTRAELDDLLDVLSEAGLLDSAETGEAGRFGTDHGTWALRTGQPTVDVLAGRERAAVVIHGGGRLATGLAGLLAGAGVGWVHVDTDGSVEPDDIGCGYLADDVGRPRREAARDVVRRAAPQVRSQPIPAQRLASLAVLTDGEVTDPALVTDLMARRIAHLQVRVREGVGIVGPLVFPGRSSCLRCADLHRCDGEPAWPLLATQLVAAAAPAELTTAQATAALAASQALLALGWSEDRRVLPPSWNATLELDPIGGSLSRRSWQPHQECHCHGGAAQHPPGFM